MSLVHGAVPLPSMVWASSLPAPICARSPFLYLQQQHITMAPFLLGSNGVWSSSNSARPLLLFSLLRSAPFSPALCSTQGAELLFSWRLAGQGANPPLPFFFHGRAAALRSALSPMDAQKFFQCSPCSSSCPAAGNFLPSLLHFFPVPFSANSEPLLAVPRGARRLFVKMCSKPHTVGSLFHGAPWTARRRRPPCARCFAQPPIVPSKPMVRKPLLPLLLLYFYFVLGITVERLCACFKSQLAVKASRRARVFDTRPVGCTTCLHNSTPIPFRLIDL
jgi:hypothetical protein